MGYVFGESEMKRQRLLREAREEYAAAIERRDLAAGAYANVAVGLLNGLIEEPLVEQRERMTVAVAVCLESARHLLWGDPKVRCRDVA